MRATWRLAARAGLTGLAGLAALAAAGGAARAAAADTALPAADRAPTAAEDGGFPALRRDLLPADPSEESRTPGVVLRDAWTGRRDLSGAPALAFRLIAAPRALPPVAMPRPGTRRARLLLPVWEQMAFGSWPIVEGRSHIVYPGLAGRDSWRSGFAVLRTLSPRLTLGAEFSHDAADLIDGHANNALAVGVRYRLAGPLSLMLAGGPYVEHQGGTGLTARAGLNLAF